VGRETNVFENCAAFTRALLSCADETLCVSSTLYPLPTHSLGSFVEEGALAPQFR